MLKVIKVRLYPDSQQQYALSQSFGNCRWLWNYCLNLMNQTYKETGNLKIKQQQLSRKQKGSNNRNKSRKKVAKVHNKIANCRSDFHHKLSRRIVNENQVICVENLVELGLNTTTIKMVSIHLPINLANSRDFYAHVH